MKMLIIVNFLFAAGLGFLLAFNVISNPLWLAFIVSWCVAEGILARDQSIKWWQWTILLISLAALDGLILVIFG